jgi:hypothetical protein
MAQIVERARSCTNQRRLVPQIRELFGDEWLYKNQNNNWAIDRRVLREFAPLKTPYVLWEPAINPGASWTMKSSWASGYELRWGSNGAKMQRRPARNARRSWSPDEAWTL